jgi:DNA-binding XRE family transcriptional regulator
MQTMKQARLAAGVTLEHLARDVDRSLGTITSIEGYHHEPTVGTALKIAARLGVRVDEIDWPVKGNIKLYPSREKKREKRDDQTVS